jgi:hypothetical protein
MTLGYDMRIGKDYFTWAVWNTLLEEGSKLFSPIGVSLSVHTSLKPLWIKYLELHSVVKRAVKDKWE